MKHFRFCCFLLMVSFWGATAQGQALFVTPDTTPNYRGYQHIEECWKAALRITDVEKSLRRESIWWDTIAFGGIEEIKKRIGFKEEKDTRRPESAIEAASICLEKFNVDTVKILSAASVIQVMKILLIAHRDEDAEKFAQRFLDSLRRESESSSDSIARKKARHNYKWWFAGVADAYRAARPGRYDVAKRYYTDLLSIVKADGDSIHYSIDIIIELAIIAQSMKDSVAEDAAWKLALYLNDSIPSEERKTLPGYRMRSMMLESFVAKDTKSEALDSLAISNVAYNLWRANVVKQRVYGGKILTKDDEQAQSKKLPELTGDYYYIADNATITGASAQGRPTYTKKGAVPKAEFPIKNSINYIVSLPSFCHAETTTRTADDKMYKIMVSGKSCLDHAASIRALKREFPDMEIIGLSSTYGTVGQLGPLTPDQDADTLAKLFLEFHRLPVRLVVEKTEFFHLPEPDGRRGDLETPNSQALGESVKNVRIFRLTDKDGYMIDVPVYSGSEFFKHVYETLKNRPSK